MKNLLITLMIVLTCILLKTQILTPVKWTYTAKKINKTEALVLFKATIDEGWHIYSQNINDGGPGKTTFTFIPGKDYQLVGNTKEPKPIRMYEKIFNMDVNYFKDSVVFQQKVKLKGNGVISVKGVLNYMTCKEQKCLPPENVEFKVDIK